MLSGFLKGKNLSIFRLNETSMKSVSRKFVSMAIESPSDFE